MARGPTRAGTRTAVPFGSLRSGQQFRMLDEHGQPVMDVLYTRIPETLHRGYRHNALGWGRHPNGREGRAYCAFALATLVLLDTFNSPTDPADDAIEIVWGVDDFDPASTPGPRPGIVDPNLDDLW